MKARGARASARASRLTLDALLAALLAPPCVVCARVLDAPSSGAVCAACWDAVRRFTPPVCDGCGEPLALEGGLAGGAARCAACEADGPLIHRARAVGPYEGTLREIVHALKYHSRRSLAPQLAARLRPAADALLAGADAVVPVPLHWRRAWARGFNQADLLASALVRAGGPAPPVLRALRRVRPTPSQSALDAPARRRNVAGAFALAARTARGRARLRQRLTGRTLVLVDDVTTTGATLEAAARVLCDAGVREVRAVTVARVGLRK